MEIVMRKVSELTPYDRNAKKHDATQIDNVANSIKRFGWQQPIVIDENGVVVIGHCRLLAAKKLKMKEVPVTVASGLTEDEIKELRIADNKTNESPWDLGLLAEDISGLDFAGFDLDFGIDGETGECMDKDDNTYTSKISAPQYEMKGDRPDISALVNQTKTDALLMEVEGTEVPEEIKQFLRLAAYRHLVFDYHNIAEYYAHATPEVQELMERSALVIIDYDDAIAGGYVKLRSELDEMLEEALALDEE